MTFKEAVLAWLQDRIPGAAAVTEVVGNGSDWQGSTEGGFYDTFAVEIWWQDGDGDNHREEVAGEDMEALWTHVMRSWQG